MERLDLGPISLIPSERRLLVHGQAVPVGSRAFSVLVVLAERRDRVVSKQELLDLAWPGLIVEENNLTVQIAALRKLLGSSAITTIQGQGYCLSLSEAQERAGHDATAKRAGNIPRLRAEMFGRADELVRMSDALLTTRLLTLCGPGGIGKSTLAIAVASKTVAQFAQGAWLVDLSNVDDEGSMVFSAIAQTLGITLTGGASPEAEIEAALQTRDVLLVLDGCEHLLNVISPFAHSLLRSADRLRILATSQAPLRIHGERVHQVKPLAVPPVGEFDTAEDFAAVQLLVDRIRARQPEFQLGAHEAANAVEICQELDGIALAIELAAARVPSMGIAMVRSRLGERLRLLTGGVRTSATRHQTLVSTLAWSHQLLSANEQKALRRLSVFVGGFTLDSAQHLLAAEHAADMEVADLVASLADKSLLAVEPGRCPRYRMLESMRTFATLQLSEAGETRAWNLRHAWTMAEVCADAARKRDLSGIWREMANARAAMNWAQSEPDAADAAVAIATHTAPYLVMAGFVPEAMSHLLRVETLTGPSTPRALQARYWQWLGRYGMEGRLPLSRCAEVLRAAQAIYTELGHQRQVHATLRMRSEAALRGGDVQAAESLLGEAAAIEDAEYSPADRMRRLRIAALIADAKGDFVEALRLSRHALDIAETNQLGQYRLLLNAEVAWVQLRMGEATTAVELLTILLDKIEPGRRQGLLWAYTLAGYLAALVAADKFEQATQRLPSTLTVLRETGLFLSRSDTFAWLAAMSGRFSVAARLVASADAYYVRTEARRDRVSQYARDRALGLVQANLEPRDVAFAMVEGAKADEASLVGLLLRAFAGSESPSEREEN